MSSADLRQHVLATLKRLRPEEDFAGASDFIAQGMLDSFDVMTMVSELDAHFKVSIDGTAIVPANFRTLDAITALLERTLAEAGRR